MTRKDFLLHSLGGACLLATRPRLLAAVSDGAAPLRTAALQRAIDECHARGGGTVVVPPGRHVTGTLRLRSRVALQLEPGALLEGSTRPEDYPAPGSARGGRALIYAEGEEDITLRGEGCIDGRGADFGTGGDDRGGRPRLIQFIRCRNVQVQDLRLRNSVMWMQHYLECEHVQLRGLNIWNHANHNNDMIDIDGCRGVTISDCIGDSDDDGITLKSTGPAACENVTVTNCVLSSHCNAIKCGTESVGGFRNIAVSNCVVKPSAAAQKINGNPLGLSALSLETVDGGTLEGVAVSNLTIAGTLVPFFIRLGNRGRVGRNGPAPGVGRLRDVRISQVIARGVGAIGSSITGIPGHPVEDITFSGVQVELAEAGTAGDVGRKLAEREKSYPEGKMWGRLPAYGFYVRHANRVRFFDVRATPAAGEPRPCWVTEDVNDALGLPR